MFYLSIDTVVITLDCFYVCILPFAANKQQQQAHYLHHLTNKMQIKACQPFRRHPIIHPDPARRWRMGQTQSTDYTTICGCETDSKTPLLCNAEVDDDFHQWRTSPFFPPLKCVETFQAFPVLYIHHIIARHLHPPAQKRMKKYTQMTRQVPERKRIAAILERKKRDQCHVLTYESAITGKLSH